MRHNTLHSRRRDVYVRLTPQWTRLLLKVVALVIFVSITFLSEGGRKIDFSAALADALSAKYSHGAS